MMEGLYIQCGLEKPWAEEKELWANLFSLLQPWPTPQHVVENGWMTVNVNVQVYIHSNSSLQEV